MNLTNHHAQLIIADDRRATVKALEEYLSAKALFFVTHHEQVLDTATSKKILQLAQSNNTEYKTIIISFHSATVVAQNALLKTLEEPYSHTRFIFVVPTRTALLATVQSRLQEIPFEKEIKQKEPAHSLFLETQQSKRMELDEVQTLLKAEDSEGRKDREQVALYITQLANTLTAKTHRQEAFTLLVIEMASYARDLSASPKAILEYLAYTLPVTN